MKKPHATQIVELARESQVWVDAIRNAGARLQEILLEIDQVRGEWDQAVSDWKEAAPAASQVFGQALDGPPDLDLNDQYERLEGTTRTLIAALLGEE